MKLKTYLSEIRLLWRLLNLEQKILKNRHVEYVDVFTGQQSQDHFYITQDYAIRHFRLTQSTEAFTKQIADLHKRGYLRKVNITEVAGERSVAKKYLAYYLTPAGHEAADIGMVYNTLYKQYGGLFLLILALIAPITGVIG